MKGLGFKCTLFLGSLILSLFAAEVVLRLLGIAVQSHREAAQLAHGSELKGAEDGRGGLQLRRVDSKAIRILALGDSTTNGGNVNIAHSYPYHLFQKQFQGDRAVRIAVRNEGQCEFTSYDVYRHLLKRFEVDSPEFVLLLAGEADRFNPIYDESDDGGRVGWFRVLSSFKSLRIYKAYNAMALYWEVKGLEAFRERRIPGAGSAERNRVSFEKIAQAAGEAKNGEWEAANELLARMEPAVPEGLFFSRGDSERVVEQKLRNASTSIYREIIETDLRHQRYTDVIQFILFHLLPALPFQAQVDGMVLHWLNLAHSFQSHYSAQFVLDKLEELFPDEKKREEMPRVARNFRFYRDQVSQEGLVSRKREKYLRKTIEFARAKGVQVVLLNYPADFTEANATLRALAEEYALPFVDNRVVFERLIARDGREKWLADDEHPTRAGYRVIAENVWAVLRPLL